MTREDIFRFFGQEDKDPSETIFRLSIEYPRFTVSDFFDVLDSLIKIRGTSDDINADYKNKFVLPSRQTGKTVSHILAMSKAFERLYNTKTYYVSDIAFRNIYRIMFETNEWNDDIIFRPEFYEMLYSRFMSIKNMLNKELKPGTAKMAQYDLFETLAEFVEKTKEKIQLHSGI